jgi:hypothetical protein
VPATTVTFAWKQAMIVSVAVKNVSDHAIAGEGAPCAFFQAADSNGRKLPGLLGGCTYDVMDGTAEPGESHVDTWDLANSFKIPAPGYYAITVFVSMRKPPRAAHFIIHVVNASRPAAEKTEPTSPTVRIEVTMPSRA